MTRESVYIETSNEKLQTQHENLQLQITTQEYIGTLKTPFTVLDSRFSVSRCIFRSLICTTYCISFHHTFLPYVYELNIHISSFIVL